MNNLIAVTIGDIKGIGIEILIKEWKKGNIKNFVLITNYKLFKIYIASKKISIKIFKSSELGNEITYSKNSFNILNIKASNYDENTLFSLVESYKLTKKGSFIGIVTLPINKNKINKIDRNFIDQTSFFSKKDGKKISNMVFIFKNIFFVPLTIHIKLKNVAKEFKNTKKYIKKIKNINLTLLRDFNLINPKYILAGINPHNGENGIISNEDNKLIKPLIKELNKCNIKVIGPISPDATVNKHNLKKYDCFIFTYHDQALIPFKLISNYSGVNYTSNLDIIRVSPDHGTAYDIVGKNNQSSKGVINSFKFVKKIAKNRDIYDSSKKIVRSKFSSRS